MSEKARTEPPPNKPQRTNEHPTGPAGGGGGEEHHLPGRRDGPQAQAHRGDGAHRHPRQGPSGDGKLGVHVHVPGRQGARRHCRSKKPGKSCQIVLVLLGLG